MLVHWPWPLSASDTVNSIKFSGCKACLRDDYFSDTCKLASPFFFHSLCVVTTYFQSKFSSRIDHQSCLQSFFFQSLFMRLLKLIDRIIQFFTLQSMGYLFSAYIHAWYYAFGRAEHSNSAKKMKGHPSENIIALLNCEWRNKNVYIPLTG